MKNIFKCIYKFFASIAIKWWCFWSNIRFKNRVKDDVDLYERDIIESIDDVRRVSQQIYNRFKYVQDGIDQLWDAIIPPPQNYLNYVNGEIRDDCDGFHSAMYHCVHKTYECYLLSVFGPGTGHCLLVFKCGDLWHILDYIKLYEGKISIEDAISEYFEIYKKKYGKEVYDSALVKYDYTKGKFKKVNM